MKSLSIFINVCHSTFSEAYNIMDEVLAVVEVMPERNCTTMIKLMARGY